MVHLATLFQGDMQGRLNAEVESQKEMMTEVLHVASEVRKGTQDAMGVVNRLTNSTDVVTGAVKNIAVSTQSTAENIQTQSEMTQNIQDSIEETLKRSESMVDIAKQSGELNQNSLEIMEELQTQANTISDTNANVSQTMRMLQDRAESVRGIADTIFSISSQTNLLALNASIESARAGEAGKGFAVVADEIRQLAEKTRGETENIATVLEDLTKNAEAANVAVDRSVEATDYQVRLIEKASGSFRLMNDNVSLLNEHIDQIDNMLNSLSAANNQIVDNIAQLSATTEEVTASSAQAEGMSEDNLGDAGDTKKLLDDILQVSIELDKYTQNNQ